MYTIPNGTNISPHINHISLLSKEKVNLFSAALTEFVGRILIEKIFFQNLQIPQHLLLSLVNNVIQTVRTEQTPKVNVYQEGVIFYKQLLGKPLTADEQRYDKAFKGIDVPGEILNGIKYSALALMGTQLYTSVTSAINQGIWKHVPAIMAYTSSALWGPKVVQTIVEKALAYSGLTEEQRKLLRPWLTTLGNLALGFTPKAHANKQGVHFHYPSTKGYTQTVTEQGSMTLAADEITLEQKGMMQTSTGEYEIDYEVQFKLQGIYEITHEKIRLQVTNYEGKKIPVEFHISQGIYGKEISVTSTDKFLQNTWQQYFQLNIPKEQLTLPVASAQTNIAQLTQVRTAKPHSLSISTDTICQSSLVLSAITTVMGQNSLPVLISALSCLPQTATTATEKRNQEQNPPFTIVKLPLDDECKDMVVVEGYAYTVNGFAGLKIFDVQDSNNVTLISQYATPGDAQKIVLNKGYAYIAAYFAGLQIINIKNITHPIFVGAWMIDKPVIDVAVINNRAYIADETNILTEVDVTVPELVYQSTVESAEALDIVVSSNRVYIAAERFGLEIAEISDATKPNFAYQMSWGDVWIWDIALSGNILYVTAGNGLFVLDITDFFPKILGNLSTAFASDIAVSGNIIYLVGGSLQIIDVSNATDPKLLSTLTFPTMGALSVAISGNIAYIADYNSGLLIVNVSDAMGPQFISTFPTTGVPHNVAILGNIVYMAVGYAGLLVINVSNPSIPKVLSVFPTTDARDVTISGHLAYVADSTAGLRIVDVSNVLSPTLLATFPVANAVGVVVLGDLVYVADSTSGVRIIRVNPLISVNTYVFQDNILQLNSENNNLWVMQYTGFQAFEPMIPILSTNFKLNNSLDVVVADNLAYIIDSSRLNVVNVSNLSNPKLLSTFQTRDANSVTIWGNTAYITGYYGLLAVDVSNATIPILVNTFLTHSAIDVVILDNIAYFADGSSGLLVLDVNDNSHPKLLGTLSLQTRNFFFSVIAILGNTVYLTDFFSLFLVDVSNASNPKLLSTVSFSVNDANGIAIVDNIAYVNIYNFLSIVDVSNVTNPIFLSELLINNNYFGSSNAESGVVVVSNTAYVVDENWLYIINVSDVLNPKLVHQLTISGNANNVAVSGNIVYVVSNAGLTIFNITTLPWSPFFRLSSYPYLRMMSIVFPYAIISDYNGVEIWNIVDPSASYKISNWSTPFNLNHIGVMNNQLLLGHDSGIAVLNITDPSFPQLIYNYSTVQPVKVFAVKDGIVYLSASSQYQSTPTSSSMPSPIPPLMPSLTPASPLSSISTTTPKAVPTLSSIPNPSSPSMFFNPTSTVTPTGASTSIESTDSSLLVAGNVLSGVVGTISVVAAAVGIGFFAAYKKKIGCFKNLSDDNTVDLVKARIVENSQSSEEKVESESDTNSEPMFKLGGEYKH